MQRRKRFTVVRETRFTHPSGKNCFVKIMFLIDNSRRFVEALPDQNLDGELWAGRGGFQKAVGIIKTKKTTQASDAMWKFLTYLVFDAPAVKVSYERVIILVLLIVFFEQGGFEERYQWLKKNIVMEDEKSYAAVVGHELCQGRDHMVSFYIWFFKFVFKFFVNFDL
jgi:hypothetical protein